jgi:hypothetical protein
MRRSNDQRGESKETEKIENLLSQHILDAAKDLQTAYDKERRKTAKVIPWNGYELHLDTIDLGIQPVSL